MTCASFFIGISGDPPPPPYQRRLRHYFARWSTTIIHAHVGNIMIFLLKKKKGCGRSLFNNMYTKRRRKKGLVAGDCTVVTGRVTGLFITVYLYYVLWLTWLNKIRSVYTVVDVVRHKTILLGKWPFSFLYFCRISVIYYHTSFSRYPHIYSFFGRGRVLDYVVKKKLKFIWVPIINICISIKLCTYISDTNWEKFAYSHKLSTIWYNFELEILQISKYS